jgi:ADP-ribose pyrophosphatase YjhB (NUDIX family)
MAALTVTPEQKLAVILCEAEGLLMLPRAEVGSGERLEHAARRALYTVQSSESEGGGSSESGLNAGPTMFQQLQVFERPEDGWALTVSYLAAFPYDSIDLTEDFRVVPVESEIAQRIVQPDREIVEHATGFLRREYQLRPVLVPGI